MESYCFVRLHPRRNKHGQCPCFFFTLRLSWVDGDWGAQLYRVRNACPYQYSTVWTVLFIFWPVLVTHCLSVLVVCVCVGLIVGEDQVCTYLVEDERLLWKQAGEEWKRRNRPLLWEGNISTTSSLTVCLKHWVSTRPHTFIHFWSLSGFQFFLFFHDNYVQ